MEERKRGITERDSFETGTRERESSGHAGTERARESPEGGGQKRVSQTAETGGDVT